MFRLPLFLLFAISPLAAQITEWDARRDLPNLSEKLNRLVPLLEQLNPKDWVAKGASEAYVQQWESVRKEAGYLEQTAKALSRQPDKLTLALEAYFRMQAIETRAGNLIEAVRKYQNPAMADLLQSIAAENGTIRVGLQQYIQEVAQQRETEWRVMESEAQRCRTQLTAPTSRPAAKK